MEKPISAAVANRTFSKLLRAVREGQSYIVTSHGKPVAKIVPAEKHGGEMRGARVALLRRLRAAGQMLTLEHDIPHDVEGIVESALLLTIAWRDASSVR